MDRRRASIVLLAQDGASTRIVYHRLRERFEIRQVVLEDPVPRRRFVTHRRKRLGLRVVAGQVLFKLFAVPWLTRLARARSAEIKRLGGLDDRPIAAGEVTRVPSVNSEEARGHLRVLAPDVVVINGTRIVSGETLASVPAVFLNIHAGITPRYRGVHGGYWALWEGDRERCGVTVHTVDEGVDTGPVLAQTRIEPTSADSFVTYPLLQLAAGLPLLTATIDRVGVGNARSIEPPPGPSKLWSHPTLGQYLVARVRMGVK